MRNLKQGLLLVSLLALSPFVILDHSLAAESYQFLDANVKSLQNRVEEKRKKIKELGEEKAAVKDAEKVKEILDAMVVEARTMKESFVEFQKQKKKLKYSYPAQGEATERKYKRFEIDTIEELNSMSNIDLRLKGLMGKIERTYEKPPEVTEKEKKIREEKNKTSKTLKSKDAPEKSTLDERPTLSY